MDRRARIRAELESLARLASQTTGQAETLFASPSAIGPRWPAAAPCSSPATAAARQTRSTWPPNTWSAIQATRPGLAAIALTAEPPLLTAAGNDLGFEQVFARQVQALCRPGDLLVLHSTSGESANLLAAAAAARARGVGVVAFLGRGGGRLAPSPM